jgi:hypothetical protein
MKMSSYNLTDNQKKIITWIVQEIRNKTLPERFLVAYVWGTGLNIIDYETYPGRLPRPQITQIELQALQNAQLILFTPLDRENDYQCTVLKKAYEAVDSNFAIKIDTKLLSHNTITGQGEHIVILMITGSGNQYRTLEQAIRRVFECPPYYFEVRLTSDYTYKPDRLENIREHIKQAQGFVVEISELNPNIMFELGAVATSDQNRPIFPLRSQDAAAEVIASFSNQIHITYSSLNQSVEQLASEIRHAFERDGRIVHEGINALISHRQKRFLSRTLLENLPRTRLDSQEISSLLKHYTSVEDLFAAEPIAVARTTGLEEYVILALRGAISDTQIQNIFDRPLPAQPEFNKQSIEEQRTNNPQLESSYVQHPPLITVSISLPEQKQMNPEIFLEQTDVIPLIKALIPVFTTINGASERHSLLENADIDSAFIGNLKLDAQPNLFTPALVAAFKRYKISHQKISYHPQINLLAYLVDLAEIYGISDEGLRICDRLIKQGKENFKALTVRNAVGRIESPQNRGIGTGVLVAQNLLLTCNHIFTKTRVEKAWVTFGYKSDSYSIQDIFELDLNFVSYHNQLDFALIRLQPNPSLKPIRPVNVGLDSGQKIRLIHHPMGQPVVISGLGQIVQVGQEYIDHNLNTDKGSSGAPIFNDAWELVAIHRGNPGVGRPTKGTMEGKPISAIWDSIANHLS